MKKFIFIFIMSILAITGFTFNSRYTYDIDLDKYPVFDIETTTLKQCSNEFISKKVTAEKSDKTIKAINVTMSQTSIPDVVVSIEKESDKEESITVDAVNLPVKNILQNPELPQGCEVTSLAIAMNYAGYYVDKCYLSDNFLPKWPDLSGNPEYYYLREPRSDGFYCFAGALMSTVDNYNAASSTNVKYEDLTGSDVGILYNKINNNVPVIVWGTLQWSSPYVINGLYQNLHCMVLSGYSKDTVTITDPIYGVTTVDKQKFENIWNQMGRRALVVY